MTRLRLEIVGPVALAVAALLVAGCIQRTAGGGGPYAAAVEDLRAAGVPDRFDDGLLGDLFATACGSPAGTRNFELQPLLIRRTAAPLERLDAGGGAVVRMVLSRYGRLCRDGGESPASPAPDESTFAVTEAALMREVDDITDLLTGVLGLANARVSSPANGVLRIEGEAGTEVTLRTTGCNAAYALSIYYHVPLTPLHRAILTGDADPVVQIAVSDGAEQTVLDSSPVGLIGLLSSCFSAN